jgi:hypothetical protein
MALDRQDAVGSPSTTQGTGTLTLSSDAIQGFVPWLGNAIDGNTYRYRIQNVSIDTTVDNTQWEVTTGVWTAGTLQLTRAATPYKSSNAGARVNFTLGPLAVVMVVTAADFEVFSNIDGGSPTSVYGGTTNIDAGGP